MPSADAPEETNTLKLIEEGVGGYSYNLIRVFDRYFAIHWGEDFDIEKIVAGKSEFPIIISDSLEEMNFALAAIHISDKEIFPKSLESEFLQRLCPNLYRIELSESQAKEHGLDSCPTIQNRAIELENLFEPGNGEPITIISPAPNRSCNYRCHYCYHHEHGFTKNTDATERWSRSILAAAERIPRLIRFSAGAMGEPFFIKAWRDTAIKLLQFDNVQSLALVSNLSQPVEPFMDHVDPTRVGIMASLHPTEFKDREVDFQKFLDKLRHLKNLGAQLVVNYVLTPDQVFQFAEYRREIRAIGVPMTSNVVRGPYNGKFYPDDFSEEELNIVESCYEDNHFIFDSQSHYRNPYGLECVSGRKGFFLEFNGDLFNCHFARQRLGSIFDETLMIRTKNGFCSATKCESQTTIGWQADVDRRFRVDNTLHNYIEI